MRGRESVSLCYCPLKQVWLILLGEGNGGEGIRVYEEGEVREGKEGRMREGREKCIICVQGSAGKEGKIGKLY